MRRLSVFQKVLLIAITIGLSIVVVFGFLRTSKPIAMLSNASYGFFSMVRFSLIEQPIRSVTGFFDDIIRFYELRDENDRLKQDLDMLALYKAELEEAYRQIAALKELSSVKLASNEFELLPATVMVRSYDVFNSALTINVGSNDGVEVDMAVSSSKGLIGKISEVYANSSVVRLLTTERPNHKVAVRIQTSPSTTAEAILERYDRNQEAFVLTLLDTGSTILPEMTVITSGLGGVYPSGLLVGKVSEVQELTNAIGLRILVKPSASFYQFDYVFVVKRAVVAQEVTP